MQQLSYWVQRFLLRLFSSLPFWFLYGLSDCLFLINYYLIGYRRKTVMLNLRNSFPEKTEQEIQLIARRFYQYLSDQFVETFKTLTISAAELDKRVQVLNPEVMNALYDRGQSVVHLLGHHANWEWYAKQLARYTKHQLFFVYKPLSNKGMDRVMIDLRSRFGVMAVPMKEVFRTIESYQDRPHASFFGGDQSPMRHNKYIWLNFLHQETAVYLGAEDIAKKYNEAVVFGKMRRIKRGYYTITLELITANPAATAAGEITISHTRALEELLQEQPEYWLWSHKRWKFKKEEVENGRIS